MGVFFKVFLVSHPSVRECLCLCLSACVVFLVSHPSWVSHPSVLECRNNLCPEIGGGRTEAVAVAGDSWREERLTGVSLGGSLEGGTGYSFFSWQEHLYWLPCLTHGRKRDPRDLWHLRHLIRVMKRHPLENTFKEQSKRVEAFETFDQSVMRRNIARGTADPGYWFYNLSLNVSS